VLIKSSLNKTVLVLQQQQGHPIKLSKNSEFSEGEGRGGDLPLETPVNFNIEKKT
jgi:hypothetical protein